MTLSPETRCRGLDIATEVADRLRDPEKVADTAARAYRPDDHPRWDRSSLWVGHPGIALLFAALSTVDDSWAAATHAHLAASRGAPVNLVPAAVLHRTAHGGGYHQLLQAVGAAVRTPTTEYDVISGHAGRGRLLLSLADLGDESCADALLVVLRELVVLTRPVTAYGAEVPGWWRGPDRYQTDADRKRYPRGDFDLGLAHGIAGPLALLAIAHRRGYRVDGMTEAMRHIADWLVHRRTVDEFGSTWPSRIGWGEETGPTKAAWCYGTAGVARALQLAAVALEDRELAAIAVSALRGVFDRSWKHAHLVGPTLCHGEAGLLRITLRVTELDPDPALANAADALAQRILGAFDPAAPFGFRHRHDNHTSVDEPGLLQGAAGVALALCPTDTDWDSALLLT